MAIWDERRLAKTLRMQLKELTDLRAEVQQHGEQLAGVEADGDRGDAQRERGESWTELADAIEGATEELDAALDTVEAHFK